jgi:hypothetical protein
MVVLDTRSNGNVFCMVKFGVILLNVNLITIISKGETNTYLVHSLAFLFMFSFIHAQTRGQLIARMCLGHEMHHASLFKLMLSFLCVPNSDMNIRHFEPNTNI